MERETAIQKLAEKLLRNLSAPERAEQLEIMTLEDWSDSQGWNELSRKVRKEFENGELKQDPDSSSYDAVLRIWLTSTLDSVTNEYLGDQINIDKVTGEVPKLEPCPVSAIEQLENVVNTKSTGFAGGKMTARTMKMLT